MRNHHVPTARASLVHHEPLETSTAAASYEVTTLADIIDPEDGLLSLREAIGAANARAGHDTITFADAIRGGTIGLRLGVLAVTDDLTIDGDPLDGGPGGIRIDGGSTNPYSGFTILDLGDVAASLEDLTVQNGRNVGIQAIDTDLQASRIEVREIDGNPDSGVGISAIRGHVSLIDTIVGDTDGPTFGVGVDLQDTSLDVMLSQITGITADYGFGIAGDGEVRVENSIIAGNGTVSGAGIEVNGSVAVIGSTLYDNGSNGDIGPAAAIIVNGELQLVNSTIAATRTAESSGSGIDGAALHLVGGSTASIVSSTISGSANGGGSGEPGVGLYVEGDAQVTIANSIVDDTVVGAIVSNGANTFRDASIDGAVAGDRLDVGADELFARTEEIGTSGVFRGVLADNGGPTPTLALLDSAFNPALGGADPADAPIFDQRGYLRDATPDIGAFELGGMPPPPIGPLPPLAEKVPLPDAAIQGAPLFLIGASGDAEIAFVDEVAAFQSSLGVYLIDPDGTIGDTGWAFEQIEHKDASADASSAARPGGGPLAPGDSVLLSDLFDPADLTPGTGFGLFLVANGWSLNDAAVFGDGTLAFRSNGGSASVADTMPTLVHTAPDGAETLVLGDILHSTDADSADPLTNSLNPGGSGQVTSGLLDGSFTVAFEDKPLQLASSDHDFNDALFSVTPLVTAEEVAVA